LDYDLLEDDIVDLSFAPTLESVPRLSTRQAAAISSGLSYLVQLLDPSDQNQISELLSIFGKGALGQQQLPFMVQPVGQDRDLEIARQAVAESRAMRCSYRNSNGEVAIREIEPIKLESREDSWFLRGFCRTNKQERIFRLDRMREISLLDVMNSPPTTQSSSEEIYEVRASDTEVLFEVDPAAFSLIADYKPEFEIRGNKSIQVKISIGQIENLGRIVARYSGNVRVLAPEVARRAVAEFAAKALGELPTSQEAE
jgi:proteasome accessory factor C